MDPVKLALLPANIVAYKDHNMQAQTLLLKCFRIWMLCQQDW